MNTFKRVLPVILTLAIAFTALSLQLKPDWSEIGEDIVSLAQSIRLPEINLFRSTPKYVTGLTQNYIRDGLSCIGYRVHTDRPLNQLSDADLMAVYNDVTRGDGYYRHTVWFYSDEKSIYTGGFCDARIEQVAAFDYDISRS